jgi:hypothetical protein
MNREDPPPGSRRMDLVTIALLVFFVSLVLIVIGLLLLPQVAPDLVSP